jgi:nicotinamidase-related amidase
MIKDFGKSSSSRAILVIDMTFEGLHGFKSDHERDEMCCKLNGFIQNSGIPPIYCNTIWSSLGEPSRSYIDMIAAWGNGMKLRMEVAKKLQSAFKYDVCGGIIIPTDLDGFLKQNGIQELFVVGVEAPLCALDTAIDGVERGYKVNFVTDLCWTCESVLTSSRNLEINEALSRKHGFNLVKSTDFYSSTNPELAISALPQALSLHKK